MDDESLDRLADAAVARMAAEGWSVPRAAVRAKLEILRGLLIYRGGFIDLSQIDLDTGEVRPLRSNA
jgi:hypothetical protein